MKVAYIDCFSGISGDMFMGALLDAGLESQYLIQEIGKLKFQEEYDIRIGETKKGAIRAASFDVIHHEEHSPHRHPADIFKMIQDSTLSERVKHASIEIFKVLAEAEAKVHGESIEHVHFHEVGAVDSIIDIVGAAIGIEYLGIEKLFASALPVGSGQVKTQHGWLPLPAPATLEIMTRANMPIFQSSATVELVTPTGAAILAALASFERPNMRVNKVGIGAGKRDLEWPNVLRMILGEMDSADKKSLVMIETNIDDMNPQIFGYVMERLFAAGALDVFYTPIYMKKNRPATQLSVIAKSEDEHSLTQIIIGETSTLGVRVSPIYRHESNRDFRTVSTVFGDVPVKLKLVNGQPVQAAPEYDACVRIAVDKNVPLMQVYHIALEAGNRLIQSGN